jgi:hypothetical protein
MQRVLDAHNRIMPFRPRDYVRLPWFAMESLQSDPDYFRDAVSLLTGGRIVADDTYLAKVFDPANLGGGRRSVADGVRPPDARAQWEAWSDWERAEFAACCREHHIVEAYTPYDYDFSFVK